MNSSAPVNVGDVIAGKYRIEHVLGAGGMGIVVAATHIHLDERVAIKFLLPEALKEASVVTRFLREAKVAAKLRSEHAARVHDVGLLENGTPYFVMEYLEGSDLDALIKKRGPLAPDIAVELILQACEALADAHSIGIIHRDIKPSNLFVIRRRDGTPAVKVIDFGISKITQGADALANVTKTAEMRGSLLFMPPEQMSTPRDVDPRSDIWALGVTLFYLVTADYPFAGETPLAVCSKILRHEPTLPRSIRPDLPAELEAVLLRCLRKPPSARYRDMAELSEALSPFAPARARVSADRISRVLYLPTTTNLDFNSSTVAPISGGSPENSRPSGGTTRLPRESSMTTSKKTGSTKKQKLTAQAQTGKSSWASTNRPENPPETRERARGVTAGFIVGLVVSLAMVGGLFAFSRKVALEVWEPAKGSGLAPDVKAFLSATAQTPPVTPEPPAPSAPSSARADGSASAASAGSSQAKLRAVLLAATGASADGSPSAKTTAAPRKKPLVTTSLGPKQRIEPF